MLDKVFILIFILSAYLNAGSDIFIVKKLKGNAEVRHGVSEVWNKLEHGDTLKPDDTIKAYSDTYIEIYSPEGRIFKMSGPALLNISDIRRISVEDLLLQLAMEDIRAIPEKSDGFYRSERRKATGVYGSDISRRKAKVKIKKDDKIAFLWANGAIILFENGYYETSAIRAKNLINRFDELRSNSKICLLPARALEKLGLYGEAISEYNRAIQNIKDKKVKREIQKYILKLRRKISAEN
jgi:tetratricopeptide (TPR) repeat protein